MLTIACAQDGQYHQVPFQACHIGACLLRQTVKVLRVRNTHRNAIDAVNAARSPASELKQITNQICIQGLGIASRSSLRLQTEAAPITEPHLWGGSPEEGVLPVPVLVQGCGREAGVAAEHGPQRLDATHRLTLDPWRPAQAQILILWCPGMRDACHLPSNVCPWASHKQYADMSMDAS